MRQSVYFSLLCVSGVFPFHFDLSADRKILNATENNVLQSQCGHFKGRSGQFKSLYGTPNEIEQVPWVVSIARAPFWYPNISENVREERQYLLCSGSLISPRHIVTAAHCLGHHKADCKRLRVKKIAPTNLDRLRVYLGGTCSDPAKCRSLRRDDELLSRSVVRAYFPSDFTGEECNEVRGDIAVLELDHDVPFSNKVNPICLPKRRHLHKSKVFRISGFGSDAGQNERYSSRSGVLKTVSEVRGDCFFSKHNGSFRRGDYMGIDVICSKANYQSPCNGDSGGGVVQKLAVNSQPFVAAVHRAGKMCNYQVLDHNKGWWRVQGSIHTDITLHLDWICRVTGVCPNSSSDPNNVSQEVIEMRRLSRDEMYATRKK